MEARRRFRHPKRASSAGEEVRTFVEMYDPDRPETLPSQWPYGDRLIPAVAAAGSSLPSAARLMHALLRDIRSGIRSLLKSPGLTVVAVLALTLGIGLTTTMFSIVYGALM